MKRKTDMCQVKGCNRKAEYSYITHENGDKEMCQECREKYLGGEFGRIKS